MNQLTTTNNQFKLEESLMEKVFEASGYKLTIVTPKDSEPHFIAREVFFVYFISKYLLYIFKFFSSLIG